MTTYIKIPVFQFFENMSKGYLKIVNVSKKKKKKENDQILPYFFCDKIIKGLGTTFQCPALGQNYVISVWHTVS